MNVPYLVNRAVRVAKTHSPEILAALGVSGVLSTSYLVGRASFEASETIDIEQRRLDSEEKSHPLSTKEKVKLVWKLYIPATVSGAVTIGCVIGSTKVSGSRTAAAVTAYSITERAYAEYREKVVEEIGKGKEQKIRDQIAQEHVYAIPLGSREVITLGTGHVLCCELFTGRYFRSDMETLRQVQNQINQMIVHTLYVSIGEFYDLVGLSPTSVSDNLGWDSDKLLELQFSAVVSDNGEPCLAFDYNYTKPLWS